MSGLSDGLIPERWKPIPGFDGYEVSDAGRIRSYFAHDGKVWRRTDRPQRILSAKVTDTGYRVVNLRCNGKTCPRPVHRLVLLAFIGECPDGLEACHNDSNRLNNRLWNLRYGTHASNMKDRRDAKEMGLGDDEW